MPSYRTASRSRGNTKRNRSGNSPAPADRYRLSITLPNGATRTFRTSDLARARRIAQTNAARGAHVNLQTRCGWDYQTTHTYLPEPAP
jgi:hypothetical protein